MIKKRHYFVKKVLSSQGYGFASGHVWCYSWNIKNAQWRWIDAFELWCWRRLLTVPWTARRSKQSILKEINPEYSLEGLMLKHWSSNTLASWCEVPTWGPWHWERLAGGEGDDRGRGLDGITDSMDMNLSKLQEIVKGKGAWRAVVHGVTKSQTWPSNWTTRSAMSVLTLLVNITPLRFSKL